MTSKQALTFLEKEKEGHSTLESFFTEWSRTLGKHPGSIKRWLYQQHVPTKVCKQLQAIKNGRRDPSSEEVQAFLLEVPKRHPVSDSDTMLFDAEDPASESLPELSDADFTKLELFDWIEQNRAKLPTLVRMTMYMCPDKIPRDAKAREDIASLLCTMLNILRQSR